MRSTDGTKILLERTEKPHEFSKVLDCHCVGGIEARLTRSITECTPIQVPNENQTFMVDGTTWMKQTVGQSVKPDVTVRDVITSFSTHVKTYKYSPESRNCHEAQEAVRKPIEVNFPEPRFITRVTSTTATFVPWGILESSTCRHRSSLDSLDLAVRSVPAGLELDWDLPETSSSSYDLRNIPVSPKFQRPSLLPHLDLAAKTAFPQESHEQLTSEGSLEHLFPPFPSEGRFKNHLPYPAKADTPQEFPGPSWEFPTDAGNIPEATAHSQQRQGERFRSQARVHLPGLLGGLQNIKNCFEKGEYFCGLWNTGTLAWSAGVLYATGGAATLIFQVDPETQEPYIRVSMAGLT